MLSHSLTFLGPSVSLPQYRHSDSGMTEGASLSITFHHLQCLDLGSLTGRCAATIHYPLSTILPQGARPPRVGEVDFTFESAFYLVQSMLQTEFHSVRNPFRNNYNPPSTGRLVGRKTPDAGSITRESECPNEPGECLTRPFRVPVPTSLLSTTRQ